MISKKLCKKWKRKIRKWAIFVAKNTIPFFYLCYIKLVWKTSSVELWEIERVRDQLAKAPYKCVTVLWHQDVFCVPWIYKNMNPHTIASIGDSGEIITRILQRCNYTVLRGGSSKGKKRRKEILSELIEHMQNSQGVCGITVDGSSGPPYKLKGGAIMLAIKCRMPIFTSRIWCKHKFFLPTWDKTMVPLPFNCIKVLINGPYYPPERINSSAFNELCSIVEKELLKLAHQGFKMFDNDIPKQLQPIFPQHAIEPDNNQ